jgi:DNA-binding XRE family transcriptional regulator
MDALAHRIDSEPLDQPLGLVPAIAEHDFALLIGRRIRRRRRMLGFTQAQLAAVAGVTFQQIQKYECGIHRISAVRLWQLAQALSAPVGYFFEGIAA